MKREAVDLGTRFLEEKNLVRRFRKWVRRRTSNSETRRLAAVIGSVGHGGDACEVCEGILLDQQITKKGILT